MIKENKQRLRQHMVYRILEKKASLSFFIITQATKKIHATKDPKDVTKLQARFAAEAITFFDAHTSNGRKPTTSYHLS